MPINWTKLFNLDGADRRHHHDERESRELQISRFQALVSDSVPVLPSRRADVPPSPFPAKEVTKVALRLKHQVEAVIPYQLEEEKVTKPHSPIITDGVVKTAKSAGGEDYKACVVFCLLIVKKWFKRQATLELWDMDLHNVRATACEVLAKHMWVASPPSPPLLDMGGDTADTAMQHRRGRGPALPP